MTPRRRKTALNLIALKNVTGDLPLKTLFLYWIRFATAKRSTCDMGSSGHNNTLKRGFSSETRTFLP